MIGIIYRLSGQVEEILLSKLRKVIRVERDHDGVDKAKAITKQDVMGQQGCRGEPVSMAIGDNDPLQQALDHPVEATHQTRHFLLTNKATNLTPRFPEKSNKHDVGDHG